MARGTAAAVNSLAGTRNTLLRRRGQKHFIEPVIFDARIGRPCLDALFEALGQRQEVGREVLRFKAAQMGRSQIAWFDLEAPTQTGINGEAPIDWSEACQLVQEAFDRSYPELGSFFRDVVAKRWIDWSLRRGKLPGGFCTTSSLSGESRIFMTYNGTINDVMTLAHEAGHAFHGHLLADRRGLVRSYPMTLAETASTFAEQLLAEGIIGDPNRPPAHKKRLLDSQVRHAVTFLLDIPIRYQFERRFNEERQAGEVSVSRLKELMSETQREWLGDVLESDGEDPSSTFSPTLSVSFSAESSSPVTGLKVCHSFSTTKHFCGARRLRTLIRSSLKSCRKTPAIPPSGRRPSIRCASRSKPTRD
jgi:oligoendopeptidase F